MRNLCENESNNDIVFSDKWYGGKKKKVFNKKKNVRFSTIKIMNKKIDAFYFFPNICLSFHKSRNNDDDEEEKKTQRVMTLSLFPMFREHRKVSNKQ